MIEEVGAHAHAQGAACGCGCGCAFCTGTTIVSALFTTTRLGFARGLATLVEAHPDWLALMAP